LSLRNQMGEAQAISSGKCMLELLADSVKPRLLLSNAAAISASRVSLLASVKNKKSVIN